MSEGNQVGLKLNGTDKLLVRADDVDYWEITNTIKKNTEALIDSSKVVGLEADTEESMYMLMSHHQN
jgi:hypothetical protein